MIRNPVFGKWLFRVMILISLVFLGSYPVVLHAATMELVREPYMSLGKAICKFCVIPWLTMTILWMLTLHLLSSGYHPIMEPVKSETI